VIDAEFYVLDSPDRYLDVALHEVLLRLMRQRCEAGAGFLISLDDRNPFKPDLDQVVWVEVNER
jgi:ABC-type cobalamin transport system ATPase subunit